MKQEYYIVSLWAKLPMEENDEHDRVITNSFLFPMDKEEREFMEKLSVRASRFFQRQEPVGVFIYEVTEERLKELRPEPYNTP
jgi:hypothetical protein